MLSVDEVLETTSVVIPIGPGDKAWRALLPDLRALPRDAEVVFVATDVLNDYDQRLIDSLRKKLRVLWILSPRGRARQMNRGATAANGRFLWFLHCDCRFSMQAMVALAESVCHAPGALHYFHLRYEADGPNLTFLNALGVELQSQVAGLPVGQQGYCLSRHLFEELGTFSTQLSALEDVDLILRARNAGIPLLPVKATLSTSARRFNEKGWVRATLHNLRDRLNYRSLF